MGSSNLRLVYLQWLENELVSLGTHRDRSYTDLVTKMFDTEFKWMVAMDDNRLSDAMEVRAEFGNLHGISRGEMMELNPPSFIEVLLGLARRLEFVAGGTAGEWAWQLLVNLELERAWDRLSRAKMNKVVQTMERVIFRTYEPNGVGGFFPLAWSDQDQRRVELWYQLQAYAAEQAPEH